MPRLVRVAFNVRFYGLFDYYLPPDAQQDIIGRRVLAPFGKKSAVGIIMEDAVDSSISSDKIKTISRLYYDMPPLPPATLALVRFCAEYYHQPIGIAVHAALPAFFRRSNTYRPPAGYCLAGHSAETAETAALSGNAAAIYGLLQQGVQTLADIKPIVAHPHHALKRLLAMGIIERCHVWESHSAEGQASPPPLLTAQQQQAVDALQLNKRFIPHLLFGATGSGKSEIYMRAAERILAAGKQVLILTPEIHLTPQLEDYFRQRFPNERIALLHSRLPAGERARRWLMAGLGEAGIVLGTRLAVFTSLPKLGLIIVDEEHDESFKQEEGGLIFSARNVAAWRAKNENIPLICGSATPSLESLHNARRPNWQLLTLPARISGMFPQVDILSETDSVYNGMESAFVRHLTQMLAQGRQCLIFINRRGYAPALLCRQCHQAQQCRRCSNNMTIHRRRNILSCHLCGDYMPLPMRCMQCGGKVIAAGSGTQRIEETLARMFPEVSILRIDRDAQGSRKDAFSERFQDIQSGKIQLLIGTQLIAKGHNFPHLSFIGILNADAALAASDLRAEERLFALLSQVIGRGTRNPDGCRVLIQTRYPNHPFYRELQNDDVNACWQRLLNERKHTVMPPFAHLAVLRGKDTNRQRLDAFMQQTSAAARNHPAAANVQIFDAVTPPIEKISHWYRQQILIHARRRHSLQFFLQHFVPTLPLAKRWSIDIDPLTI